jgi:flavin reductase (DIM6/NTAB) family NADH-FMN oxidoreductase RutF
VRHYFYKNFAAGYDGMKFRMCGDNALATDPCGLSVTIYTLLKLRGEEVRRGAGPLASPMWASRPSARYRTRDVKSTNNHLTQGLVYCILYTGGVMIQESTAIARRAVLANVSCLEQDNLVREVPLGPFEPTPWQQSVDPDTFKQILGSFPSGVTVVTTTDVTGQPVGLTATAVASVSMDPPQLLVCLAEGKYTLQSIRYTSRFAVNILSGEQASVSTRFASSTPRKFDDVFWRFAPTTGMPIIEGSLAHAECEVEHIVPAGDHTIVIGRIVHGEARDGSPLLYHARRYATWPGTEG